MVVLILERVPTSLRGELTRWMIQPRAGVFVGNVSAMVREKLWEKARRSGSTGAGMLIYSSNTEQGFALEAFGDTSRRPVDMEGVILVAMPPKP